MGSSNAGAGRMRWCRRYAHPCGRDINANVRTDADTYRRAANGYCDANCRRLNACSGSDGYSNLGPHGYADRCGSRAHSDCDGAASSHANANADAHTSAASNRNANVGAERAGNADLVSRGGRDDLAGSRSGRERSGQSSLRGNQ